jgi:NAD(P)-dependent dehydrogenase (short-subunit alcohol dehydrogenase family)
MVGNGHSLAGNGPERMKLEQKTVLVTGASSGLGLRCAEVAAGYGATVIAVARNVESLRSQFPDPHHVISCDVSTEDEVRALVQTVKAIGRPIDGWVFAAGTQEIRPLLMESRETLERSWATNVYGSLGLLAAALKARLVAKGGSVVLFSSAATQAGGAGIASYAATKGALEAATHSLAIELSSHRIRVNAVAPGVVKTAMADKYMSRMTQQQVESLASQHPLGLGVPDFIAEPVAFLLSDLAQWITGSVLVIDGGLTSH